ncbi:MAG: DNA recombination protein RmuC [Clostridia bacterium]|nr:DNA recombination protein RmuC [Clostridia bacterium]
MQIALLIIGALCLVLLAILVVLNLQSRQGDHYEDILDKLSDQRRELNDSIHGALNGYGQLMNDSQRSFSKQQNDNQVTFQHSVELRLDAFERANSQRMDSFERTNSEKLEGIRQTMEKRIGALQEDNNKHLERMQQVVDEKLQSTLENRISKSFEMVSKQLEEVYKGLGEMQRVAVGVTDLKKVLSNVKTRGILGEIQLGAILEQILSPEQYDTNVATRPGSSDRVEYAVKLPGNGEGTVYLPIDAKFPGDTYRALMDAYDSGDSAQVTAAAAALTARLKQEAKDISGKYIAPPSTTDFAILFLPFEGLYAEAVNRGMVEELQRRYKVNIAGPSTMAALLNSLQMGFKTLAIEKRSGEVWEVLRSVRTEFESFGEVLEASQRHLQMVSGDLDKLVGVRTRQIQNKLKNVEKLEESK